MPDYKAFIAITATVIADAAWLYPISMILGSGFTPGAPLLPLAIILLLLALGFGTSLLALHKVADPSLQAPVQAITGLAVIYLFIATIAGESGLDLLWGPHMVSGAFSGRQVGGLIAGMAAAGFLWHRGVRIAVETHPRLRLLQTFRTGLVALGLAILVEQAAGIDASATVMLILFFAASLSGLAFGRLAPGGAWTPIVGLAVAAVLGGGFFAGMIGAVIGGHGLGLLAAAWSYLSVVVLWLLEMLFAFLLWILPDLASPQDGSMDWRPPKFQLPDYIKVEPGPGGMDLSVQLLQYAGLLLALYLAYRLLAWAYRMHTRQRAEDDETERESIQGNADAKADMLNLLWDLLPDWLRPAQAAAAPHFPRDKPGISEVYALYFDMLTAACEQGHDFVPSATPRERRGDIEAAIPGAPVAPITNCFTAACYGHIATDLAIVERLRQELEAALGRPSSTATTH